VRSRLAGRPVFTSGDRAILETLYATGIRRAELLALTIYDADLQTATLRIEHGKGNTKRVVPLIQSAIAALKLYLEEALVLFAHEAGWCGCLSRLDPVVHSMMMTSCASSHSLSTSDKWRSYNRNTDLFCLHDGSIRHDH